MSALIGLASDWLNSLPTVYDLMLWYRELTPVEFAGTIGVIVGTIIRDALGRITAVLFLAWWRGEKL